MWLTNRASNGGNVCLALQGEAQRLAAAKAVLQSMHSRSSLCGHILSICSAFARSAGFFVLHTFDHLSLHYPCNRLCALLTPQLTVCDLDILVMVGLQSNVLLPNVLAIWSALSLHAALH